MSKAVLHRMVTNDHVCPHGLKAKDLLEREGFDVEDHHLESKAAAEAFKKEHEVATTPQIWIDGERIGGYDDLRVHLGKDEREGSEKSYRPVLAIFAMGLLLALAIGYAAGDGLATADGLALGAASTWWLTLQRFVAITMCLLAVPKLQDVEKFSTMFLGYDLLARRWVPYSYVYPYAEGIAGVLMVAGFLPWIAGPLALFVGGVGAASVVQAVYVEGRDLRCACVGGDSNVPLGFVSLTENVMMLGMGASTIWRALG